MATVLVRARSAGDRDSGEAPDVVASAGDFAQIEAFLNALARSIRQFHTYPAASSHCVDAIQEAHRTLNLIDLESLACVVSPRELLVSGCAIGRDTPVEQELARRLYESRCVTLAIDRSATTRELARLCVELAGRRKPDEAPLDERLRKHGVERINVSSAYQPVLLDVEATDDACAVVEQDRSRQESEPSVGRVAHLYPADKGWVRIDPALPLKQVTLSGLARLVDDPASLAEMIAKLAGESDESLGSADALEQRCEDVARLYTSLDPAASRVRFARLANAVLTLDSQRRRRLLAKTVLPGLVDGRPEGNVLRDFPDVDLADALSLLLDVEAAAPELLNTALDRLQLSSDRRLAMAPLLEQRIRAHGSGESASLKQDAALSERTRQLIQVVNGESSFHDFAAFDLCTDDATELVIAGTNQTIHATNLADTQLACVSQLIALSVNAETVEGLLRHVTRHLAELERTQSQGELVARLEALQRTAAALRDSRPHVSTSIADAIQAFYTPARFERLVSMYETGGEQRELVNRLVSAVGASLTSAVVRNLQERTGDKRVLQLVCDHAATFAPALGKVLDHLPVAQRIAAIRALAMAGRGVESYIARQLAHQSEAVVRESLSALAQVGSQEAADFLTRHLQRHGGEGTGAEELLWQFAPAVTRHCLRTLLRQRQFVIDNPDLISRLLARVDAAEASKLGDVLTPLTAYRFRFWNRRLSRVGRQATALQQ
jgi:hypothetical protein